MADTTAADSHVFASSLWVIGGVGTVIWAVKKGKKGKFWWFLGGAVLGSAVGAIIDYETSK